jgi:hypothetical protein
LERDREAVKEFVQHNHCLQFTGFCDDPEIALKALEFDRRALDAMSPRLQKDPEMLRQSAEFGPAFFKTDVGKRHRRDLELACVAARSEPSGDILSVVDVELHGARLHASRFVGFYEKDVKFSDIIQLMDLSSWQESREFIAEVLKLNGMMLEATPHCFRMQREFVLLAAASRAEALQFAHARVWVCDEGFREFLTSLLACGCNKDHFPPDTWTTFCKDMSSPLAASVLLKKRSFWSELPDSVKERFPDCREHECTVCSSLPEEFFSCVGGCLNYVCRGCAEDIARHAKVQGLPPRCPTCREDRHCSDLFGARNRDAEKLVLRELEAVVKEPALKKARMA